MVDSRGAAAVESLNSLRQKQALIALVISVSSTLAVNVYGQSGQTDIVTSPGDPESTSDSTTDQVSVSDLSPASKDVPRTTSESNPTDPDRLASKVIFPDGEIVPIKWWAGQSANHAREPYDEKFLELLELARDGDAYAAFSAFGILDACASNPRSSEDIEARIELFREAIKRYQQESQDERPSRSEAELEQRIDYMRSSFVACGRIAPKAIEDREQLLRQAAHGGVTTAMNWLGQSSKDHGEAVDILEKSWALGSFSALPQLAWRYKQSYASFHESTDKVRAFAALYAYAALLENAQTLRAHEANILTDRAWEEVESYARHLDDDAIEEAMSVAKLMIKNHPNCCKFR